MKRVTQFIKQVWTADGRLLYRFTAYSPTDIVPPGLITATPIEDGYELRGLKPPPLTVFHFLALVARRNDPVIAELEKILIALKTDAKKAAQARMAEASSAGDAAATSFFGEKSPPNDPDEDEPPVPAGKR